jgi:hypothetical protein
MAQPTYCIDYDDDADVWYVMTDTEGEINYPFGTIKVDAGTRVSTAFDTSREAKIWMKEHIVV